MDAHRSSRTRGTPSRHHYSGSYDQSTNGTPPPLIKAEPSENYSTDARTATSAQMVTSSKRGHKESECYQKNGYPQDSRSSQQRQSNNGQRHGRSAANNTELTGDSLEIEKIHADQSSIRMLLKCSAQLSIFKCSPCHVKVQLLHRQRLLHRRRDGGEHRNAHGPLEFPEALSGRLGRL